MNTKFAYIITFITLLAGALLSNYQFMNDSTWLARSGSIVVVIGILYSWMNWHNNKSQIEIFASYIYLIDEMEQKNDSTYKKGALERDRIRRNFEENIEKDSLTGELIIVCLGTLVWGFGDIPFKLIS